MWYTKWTRLMLVFWIAGFGFSFWAGMLFSKTGFFMGLPILLSSTGFGCIGLSSVCACIMGEKDRLSRRLP